MSRWSLTGKRAAAWLAALFSAHCLAESSRMATDVPGVSLRDASVYSESRVERSKSRRPYEPPSWFVRMVPSEADYRYLDRFPIRGGEHFQPMGYQPTTYKTPTLCPFEKEGGVKWC